jgi:hypothetical protein
MVAKLSGNLTRLVWCTYVGGRGDDFPRGEVYLVGNTSSKDFPVTPRAAQRTLRGKSDAFILKLVPTKR